MRGNCPSCTAWRVMEKTPEITAWDAMMVAKAAKFPVGMKALANGGCISCGACVASCPNGSGQLSVGTMLKELPPLATDDAERRERSAKVIGAAEEQFGPCSLLGDCVEVCPAGLPVENLSAVARENLRNRFPRRGGDTPGPR